MMVGECSLTNIPLKSLFLFFLNVNSTQIKAVYSVVRNCFDSFQVSSIQLTQKTLDYLTGKNM